jgi:hypothetical protein
MDEREKMERIRSKMTREEAACKVISRSRPAAEVWEAVLGRIVTGCGDLRRLLCGRILENYSCFDHPFM